MRWYARAPVRSIPEGVDVNGGWYREMQREIRTKMDACYSCNTIPRVLKTKSFFPFTQACKKRVLPPLASTKTTRFRLWVRFGGSNVGIRMRAQRCLGHPFSDSFCIAKIVKMNESSASARDALRRRAWNLLRETAALRSPCRQQRAGRPVAELSYSKCKFRDYGLR